MEKNTSLVTHSNPGNSRGCLLEPGQELEQGPEQDLVLCRLEQGPELDSVLCRLEPGQGPEQDLVLCRLELGLARDLVLWVQGLVSNSIHPILHLHKEYHDRVIFCDTRWNLHLQL